MTCISLLGYGYTIYSKNIAYCCYHTLQAGSHLHEHPYTLTLLSLNFSHQMVFGSVSLPMNKLLDSIESVFIE